MTETTKTNATTTLTRANRIAIQTTPVGFKADFYRTHKHLATMLSEDTAWTPDETANKSAQREDFRQYAINNAGTIGILWQPNDLRAEGNKRVAQYTTDEILKEDAKEMMWDDLWNLTYECGLGVGFDSLTADTITPMTTTAKGYDLSKMGIVDGKYSSTGNWAWAEVEMTLTLHKDGQEIYYMTICQLVSGQLKKPHITKTSFTESIKQSLKDAGVWEEPTKEAKVEESTKADKVGLGDEEHEGLHMDMTAEEEAKAMAEAEEFFAKTETKKSGKGKGRGKGKSKTEDTQE